MRLFHDIFQNFEFDCFGSDEGCMERTSKIRSDMAPAISGLLNTNYLDGVGYARIPNDRSTADLGKDLCFGETPTSLKSLALGMARLYDYSYYDFEVQMEFEDAIFRAVSPYFRAPVEQFVSVAEKVLEGFLPDYERNDNLTDSQCLDTFNTYTLRYVREPVAALYNSFGYSSPDKMSLGDVMMNAVRENYAGRQFDRNSLKIKEFNDEQTALVHALQDIFFALVEPYALKASRNESLEISPRNFLGYFGPDPHVYSNAPPMRNDNPILCDYTDNRNRDPCLENETLSCCQIAKDMSVEREAVLRIMKYSIGPQSKHSMEESEKADIQQFAKPFDYTRETKTEAEFPSTNPLILACKFGKETLNENCQLFRKTFTNAGIGYTFNAEDFWKIHKNTEGNRAFYQQMVKATDNDTSDQNPHKIEGNGRGFSLDLLLSLDNDKYYDGKSLTIHDPATVADIRNEVINLKPGMVHEISIVPSAVVTDEAGLKLSPLKRECLTQSESDDLKIYKTYSQSACLLECQLQNAIAQCRCTRWDYPIYDDSIQYCTSGEQAECFEAEMESHLERGKCDCPNDCSITEYSVATTVTPIPDSGGSFCDENSTGIRS